MVWNRSTTSGTTAGTDPPLCSAGTGTGSDSGGCRSGVSAAAGTELVAGRPILPVWHGRAFEEVARFFHGHEDTDCGPLSYSPGGGSRGNPMGRWLSAG